MNKIENIRSRLEIKTDEYYEIKSHEPLDPDCICPSCICELNNIPVVDFPKDLIKDIICQS